MARKPNLTIYQISLLVIVFVAGVIRLVGLSNNPPSLYWEEAALGYDAYSILKTGKDYHGNSFPIVAFPSFGDYKPSLYFYAAVPGIALFNLTNFAIRFPSALAGIIAVWLVYLIARQLKLSQIQSLASALMLAIMPWHIQFSRAAFEVNLGTTLFLAGLLFMLNAREKNKYMYLATLMFALSMYAYHGFRILAPLTALITWAIYRKQFNFKTLAAAFFLAFLLVFPIITNINNPIVNQRFKETSFFPHSSAVAQTNELREQFGNGILVRVIFHRYWWWTGELIQNYLANFHPNFLFMQGDTNPRHGIGEFGVLYHWQIIALVGAAYLLLNQKKSKIKPIVLWLLLVPLPVMLTHTNPHALRMLPAAPLFALIIGATIGEFAASKHFNQIVTSVVLTIIVIEASVYLHFYASHYPSLSARDWQHGYQQTIEFVEGIKDQYSFIYFTNAYGRASIYALFYGKYDPSYIQSIDGKVTKDQLEIKEFGKYLFTESQTVTPNSLVVTASPSQASNHTLLKTINFPGGEPAFLVYEQN